MYSIRERKNKDGSISFSIQIKIIGFDGNEIQRATTWKPTNKLTEKQLKLAVNRVAKEYEAKVIDEFAGKTKPKFNQDTFFDEVALMWLKNIKENRTASHYASSKNGLAKILPLVSVYKIKDFTPSLVEEINGKIDEMKTTRYKVSAKVELYNLIRQKFGYKFFKILSEKINVPRGTIKDAVKGERTSYETAKKIADGLEMPLEEIFNVQSELVYYKSSYYESMKKVIRGTLDYAVKLGVIERNSASRLYVTTKHKDIKKIGSLTKAEVVKLINQCQKMDIRKRLALMFLLMTGTRKGEICGLNWSDIDFKNKIVSIKRQYEAVSGAGLLITKPKTPTSCRDFTIPECIVELFLEYRKWYDDKKELVGNKWEGVDDAVFIGRYGKRLHPTTIRNWFDEALETAGIKHYCVHSLRHTNVTLLLDANVPVVTVSQRVGHAKSSTTLNIYADHLVESDREASNKLGSYFEQVEKNNI